VVHEPTFEAWGTIAECPSGENDERRGGHDGQGEPNDAQREEQPSQAKEEEPMGALNFRDGGQAEV
jgi:hypothetical protein